MKNPLENPTNLATVNRTNDATTTSSANFVAQNFAQIASTPENAMRAGSQPPSSPYTTQSLTSPIKGIIPRLQREASEGIPIPGRAQSHDDIRMLGTGSGYSSPNSNYCISPNSPRGQYMYSCSPVGMNSSPPINYHGSPTKGGYTVARRALSRATSPLSSSVPGTGGTYINAPKIGSSTHNRNSAVSNNSSRSEMCTLQTHTHAITVTIYSLLWLLQNQKKRKWDLISLSILSFVYIICYSNWPSIHSIINGNTVTMHWLNRICLIRKRVYLFHIECRLWVIFFKHHFTHSIRTGSWNGLRTSFTQLSRLILYILTVLWREEAFVLYIFFFVVIWYFSLVL